MNNLLKTWTTQTLTETQSKYLSMIEDYNSEPISTRTEYDFKFYKGIANKVKLITAELKTR